MKVMVKTAPPLASAGAVFVLGGVVLGLCSARRPRPTRAQARRAALAGTLMLAGGQGLVTVLLTKLTVSLVSVVITTVPLWIVVITRLRGTLVSRCSYARLIAGFIGVAVVIISAPGAAIGGSPSAVVGCCMAPVLWAAGSLLTSRRDSMPDDLLVTAAIQLVAGGLTLLVLAAALGQLSPAAWTGVTADSLAAGAFLLAIDSLAGFMLYTRLLRNAPPQLVSTYAYVTPLVSIAIGTTILGEPLWLGAVAGALLVIATVALEIQAQQSAPPIRSRKP
jgi:drug/metabolite transporter (DMT)-like permease